MIGTEYGIEELPDPSEEPPLEGALVPNESLGVPGLVVEYRNHPVVASPLGLALPLSVAVVPTNIVAALVITVGGGGGAGVVKVNMDPNDTPPAFCANAQK